MAEPRPPAGREARLFYGHGHGVLRPSVRSYARSFLGPGSRVGGLRCTEPSNRRARLAGRLSRSAMPSSCLSLVLPHGARRARSFLGRLPPPPVSSTSAASRRSSESVRLGSSGYRVRFGSAFPASVADAGEACSRRETPRDERNDRAPQRHQEQRYFFGGPSRSVSLSALWLLTSENTCCTPIASSIGLLHPAADGSRRGRARGRTGVWAAKGRGPAEGISELDGSWKGWITKKFIEGETEGSGVGSC